MWDAYKRDGSTGLFVPKRLAKKIGIGCPKCDKCFMQDPGLGQTNPGAQKFIREHMRCGNLDALEERDGKLVCTGPVILKMAQ